NGAVSRAEPVGPPSRPAWAPASGPPRLTAVRQADASGPDDAHDLHGARRTRRAAAPAAAGPLILRDLLRPHDRRPFFERCDAQLGAVKIHDLAGRAVGQNVAHHADADRWVRGTAKVADEQ